MRRKLATETKAVEVRPVAPPLAPVPYPIPRLGTPNIPAGQIVQFSAEENELTCVRVTWQAKVWRIDKGDWDFAETV